MSGPVWVAFIAAASAGAVARSLVDSAVKSRLASSFPLGILVINVSGSFVLGVLVGLATRHAIGPSWRLVFGTGFCGAYTTFSGFAFESVRLAEDGAPRSAVANLAVSTFAGAAAAALGLIVAAL